MKSIRSLEGYLLIDNRCSGDGMQENPVATCQHCHAQVILNPLRTRERGFCRSCFGYVCDSPGCRDCNGSLNKLLDQQLDDAHRKLILF